MNNNQNYIQLTSAIFSEEKRQEIVIGFTSFKYSYQLVRTIPYLSGKIVSYLLDIDMCSPFSFLQTKCQ